MFTKNGKHPQKVAKKGRGRPHGITPQGHEMRNRLYETAIRLIATRGYDVTTLRDVAREVGVSVGLLYKYFPSKRAVVLTLYDTLSAEYAHRGTAMAPGKWRQRFLFAVQTSLDVLRPHRQTLVALTPVLVGDPEEGLFSPQTAFSRIRVLTVFRDAVVGASDAPPTKVAEALGRILYMLHLMVILLWLLDKSPKQRATSALMSLLEKSLSFFTLALRLSAIRSLVAAADGVFQEALFLPE
jgi:AcrR family transcriptional regulator